MLKMLKMLKILLIFIPLVLCDNAVEDLIRLTTILVPKSYIITINIPNEVLTTPTANKIQVVTNMTIHLKLKHREPSDIIQFHADPEFVKIQSVILIDEDDIVDLKFDQVKNCNASLCAIKLPRAFDQADEGILSFNHETLISTSDKFGLYKVLTNKDEYMIVSHFEPMYARRAFPCLDEPPFKAGVNITVFMDTELNYTVLTNTKNGDKHWYESDPPNMPMHTVALAVFSKFTLSTTESFETEHTIWTSPTFEKYRNYSLNTATRILDEMNVHLRVNYNEKGIAKMDQVVVPQIEWDGPNWGLATYTDDALLFDETESSTAARIHVALSIGHQFSHMWFGNMMSLDWWDIIFLNEGFATYFKYRILKNLESDWEMDQQFIIDVFQKSMELDAVPSIRTVQSNVSSIKEIQDHFDDFTCLKGASVLKIIENVVTPTRFQIGIQNYLTTGNLSARPFDLWQGLQHTIYSTENISIAGIMHDWINEPGFPLVQVDYISRNKINVSQSRYVILGDLTPSKWQIAINFITEQSTKVDTAPMAWLNSEGPQTVDLKVDEFEWLVVNNLASGYYRVNYDKKLWTALIKVLELPTYKAKTIKSTTRSQIVDDIFAMGRIGKLNYSEVFDYIRFLKSSDDYYVWVPAFRGFDYMLKRFGDDSDLGKKILETIKDLSKTLMEAVSKDPKTTMERLNKTLALEWSCRIKTKECLDDAAKKLADFLFKGTKVDPDMKSIVYCYGQKSDNDWNQLYKMYQTMVLPSEKLELLKSLACTTKKSNLEELLNNSIKTGGTVRAQDGQILFKSILEKNFDVPLSFFVKNHGQIAKVYSKRGLGDMFLDLARGVTTNEQLKQLEDLKDTLEDEFRFKFNVAIDFAKANIKWTESHTEELKKMFGL